VWWSRHRLARRLEPCRECAGAVERRPTLHHRETCSYRGTLTHSSSPPLSPLVLLLVSSSPPPRSPTASSSCSSTFPALVVSSSPSSQPNQTIKSAHHHHQPHNPQQEEEEEEEHHHVPRSPRALSDSTHVEPTLKKDTTHRHSQRKRERESTFTPSNQAHRSIKRLSTHDQTNTRTRPYSQTQRENEREREKERESTSTLATTTSLPFTCAHTHTHTHTHTQRESEGGYSEKTAKSIGYAGSPSMKSWPSSSASGLMRRCPAA